MPNLTNSILLSFMGKGKRNWNIVRMEARLNIQITSLIVSLSFGKYSHTDTGNTEKEKQKDLDTNFTVQDQ